MDLISRKALRRKVQKVAVEAWKLKMTASVETVMNQFLDFLEQAPSVPAVPLDKLCEWLERYATMDCDGCREAFGSCEDEENQEVSVCNSRERWKAMLTKWMEELDADRP